MSNRPFVILGMPRSGTSAVARALHRAGAYFGPEDQLYPADANNTTGYFELRHLIGANVRALDLFGLTPTSLTKIPESWAEHPQIDEVLEVMKAALLSAKSDGPWAIKQPMVAQLVPIYRQLFESLGLRPIYILCVRHPAEIVRSESALVFDTHRAMPMLGDRGYGSWLRTSVGTYRELDGEEALIVSYSRLMANPEKELEKLFALPETELDRGHLKAAASAIEQRLRHQLADEDSFDGLPGLVADAYRELTKEQPDPNALAIFGEQFFEAAQLFAPPTKRWGKIGLACNHQGQPTVREASYEILPRFQTLTLELGYVPESPLWGLLFAEPFRAWIRRAEWCSDKGHEPANIQAGPASRLKRTGDLIEFEGVFEPNQIIVQPPRDQSATRLEIEIYFSVTPSVRLEVSTRLSRLLDTLVDQTR